MSDEIRVKVNSYGPGRPLGLVYFDPVSGRKKAKSSGTTDWREAERLAGELEKELRAGRYAPPSKVTWGQFVERYTAEKLSALRPKSRQSALESLGKINRLFAPDRLAKVNAPLLSRFQAELRKGGAKETTIAHHLRHVKASLRWAERQGMMPKAPSIEMPKAAKGQSLARSRAVTTEEYERMLAAVAKVRPDDAPAWQRLISAAWLGGLRLGELVALSWDEGPFSVDLSGKRPGFRILAEGQKSGRDEVLPMVPELAELLFATPEAERQGRVFRLIDQRTHKPLTVHQIGRVVGKIGRKAGVVTNKAEGKYAGLHDLRRGFCTRWAKREMPAVLRRLARHASIQTTLAYYVDLDTADLAEALWAKHAATSEKAGAGNTSGNNRPEVAAEVAGDSRPNFLS
jgi:integrase